MVLWQLPTVGNSPPDNTTAQLLPTGPLWAEVFFLALGQLSIRTTTNHENYSPGPIPTWWGIVLMMSCPDTTKKKKKTHWHKLEVKTMISQLLLIILASALHKIKTNTTNCGSDLVSTYVISYRTSAQICVHWLIQINILQLDGA